MDLIRILHDFGMPPDTKYVVLGDLVDRGDFSVHTVIYLLLLKVLYPNAIYIIRGNHEFEALNKISGLQAEIQSTYGCPDLFESLNGVFAVLPFAAVVNRDRLLVHGGIGPNLKTLDQINKIPKPLDELYGGIPDLLVWSDPSPDISQFKPSSRGVGFEFGEAALTSFLEQNNLKMLVRGHQALLDGVKFEFHRKIVTVFSASNYCQRESGVCGVLQLQEDGTEVEHRLPHMPYLLRQVKSKEKLSAKSWVGGQVRRASGGSAVVMIKASKVKKAFSLKTPSSGPVPTGSTEPCPLVGSRPMCQASMLRKE
jgi:diadenosine tetraphosphatase ApaH/serine/threonine PP2A family protein phosphatase